MSPQLDLFAVSSVPYPTLPPGFRYQPDGISSTEQYDLLLRIRELPFREFEFQGFTGKRRVISFGWKYDFGDRKLLKVDDVPDFLLALRTPAARFAGMPTDAFQHA